MSRWRAGLAALAGLAVGASLPHPAHALEYNRVGELQELSGAWLFHAGDNPTFARPTLDDYPWLERRLPVEGVPWSARWEGRAWLRLHVVVDDAVAEQDLMLALGGAREAVEVYVNGALVAQRGSVLGSGRAGARALTLTGMIPAGLLHSGDNVIALRLFDPTYASGIPRGPLLLGAPDAVQARVGPHDLAVLAVRVGVGALVLFLGLAQLVQLLRRRAARDALWLLLGGACLAAVLLSGTGAYDGFIPSADLAARVPLVLGPIAVLALGSYFAHRYGVVATRLVHSGRLALLTLAAGSLLVPPLLLFFVSEPLLLLGALAVTLFAAHIAAQASRRRDRTALWVFLALAAEALLIVYDGLFVSAAGALPPRSYLGAAGVLLVTAMAMAWETSREQEEVLVRMLALKRRLEERSITLLGAVNLAAEEVDAYLASLVNEIATTFDVRRCSLMLAQPDGSVRIRTSIGLPRHATRSPIDLKKSIGGWVYAQGRPATSSSLPEGLSLGRRAGVYMSEAFISQPLLWQGQVIGVLNLSDPQAARSFQPGDEALVATLATKLAIAVAQLPRATWIPPDRSGPVVTRFDGPAPKARETGEGGPLDLPPEPGKAEALASLAASDADEPS